MNRFENLFKNIVLSKELDIVDSYNFNNDSNSLLNIIYENWYLISLNWFLVLYLILGFLVLSNSLLVILVRNPIHSVLYLILVFLSVGFYLLLLGVEFLAFLFFIVYLGAIAVLFLFVIMMLNIRLVELKENIVRYLPLSSFIFIFFILEFFFLINNTTFLNAGDNIKMFYSYKNWYNLLNYIDNIEVIGSLIYTYYIFGFLMAGIILLLAMLGAIILTLNQLLSFKRQYHYLQNRKNIYNSMRNVKNVNRYLNIWQVYKEYKLDS